VGHIEVAHLSHALPDGRVLLDDVSFRAADGSVVALIGPNGAGKTTLMRLIAGDLTAQSGTVSSSGGLGVMRQFIGGIRDETTVRDLLLSIAPQRLRDAAARLDAAELAMMERDDEPAQLRYAAALAEWGDAGGYDFEVHWDACTVAALGVPFDRCQWREVRTLSGGEQKRLALESLLRSRNEVLLLDEPDSREPFACRVDGTVARAVIDDDGLVAFDAREAALQPRQRVVRDDDHRHVRTGRCARVHIWRSFVTHSYDFPD